MPIARRHLLKLAAGSGLATIAAHLLPRQATHYAQVLAQSTPRKRALLIGVNTYTAIGDFQWFPLEGAVNDVQMQQELLTHRFGFDRSSILTLTDKQATRQAILTAFKEHLLDWAKPGDVVVVHFSGHGSQVADPYSSVPNQRVSTIVPVDSPLPPGYQRQGGTVNDITGITLWLLLNALPTNNVSIVLDCCYAGGARRGSLTVRARPGDVEALQLANPTTRLRIGEQEQDYLRRSLHKAGLSAADVTTQRVQNVPKGVILAAATADQAAYDAPFGDMQAGVFTYALTRYLWQQTEPKTLTWLMASTTSMTQTILKELFPSSGGTQQPVLNLRQGSETDRQPAYFLNPSPIPAEAVVTQSQGKQVDLFLGGIDPRTLDAFGQGARLTVVDDQGKPQGEVQIQSRQGLTARGLVVQGGKELVPGMLLQERSRAIPANFSLRIGLDASLGADQARAAQLLGAIPRIAPVSSEQGNLHYRLARVTPTLRQQVLPSLRSSLELGSLALFSPGLEPLPGSVGVPREAIVAAIARLRPKLVALLAARLLKLTLNTNSSQLQVSARLEQVDGNRLIESTTWRGRSVRVPDPLPPTPAPPQLPLNALVQLGIQNREATDLHIAVVIINSEGDLAVLSPLADSQAGTVVKAGETIHIPDPGRGEAYRFRILPPVGWDELLVVASTTPLTQAIDQLRRLAPLDSTRQGLPVSLVQNPVEAISSLLADLDTDRGSGSSTAPIYHLDTTQMAILSIAFEVVPQ